MSAVSVPGIRPVDLSAVDAASFKKQVADCVILTHDGKILMQQRPENWGSTAGCLTTFGGHVEAGETAAQGLVRELNEELGARLSEADLTFVAAVTEDWTAHTELVHIYFWQDKNNTITGCYEAEDRRYDGIDQALAHPKIMDYATFALLVCAERGLVPAA
ncbi:MAG: NUDIX domain-containing protein [Alphaproteobacteria bacterium]|nr:NUDIX domain-containing protein [Alphaproteobacteria bacterium]